MNNNNYIAGLLLNLNGVDISIYDESFLSNSLLKRMSDNRIDTLEEYSALIEQHAGERELLIGSLNISYSGFFRNPLTFDVLKQIVLPSLILKNKNSKTNELRIWSAACAAGQEAYSMAILLEELKNGTPHKLNYRIFATDQNELQIEEAKEGKFSLASLNNITMKQSAEWFTQQGETYSVIPELKKHIDFSTFNLLDDKFSSPPRSIFGSFSLIFCANILFYYDKEYREIIINKISKSLADGGYIITGEAEREILINLNYYEVFPNSAIFRK